MRSHITGRQVLQQLKADLIGKDSYRGVTLSYSWLANQFGHISLGFIPTFILYIVLSRYARAGNPSLIAPLLISCIWLLFETYNFLGPLLLQRHSRSKVLYVPGKSAYTFQPDWKNIAYDTITDLSFFWFGAFFAALLCEYSLLKLIILLVITLALIKPCIYWYPTKIYLQAAQYPYELRLAQWDNDIQPDDRQTVLDFLNGEEAQHLLIFGGKDCGKASLAVGIATELSIYHHTVVYTTAMKLYNQFFDDPKITLQDGYWSWRNSELLVIDDINPGDPIQPDLVSAEQFRHYLDTLGSNPENRKAISRRKVLWVMGSEDPEGECLAGWTAMLTGIGVAPAHIRSVNLPCGLRQDMVLMCETDQV